MAIPIEMSRHLDAWVGTLPSPWWIYLRLRLRGDLAPEASSAVVRRILREIIHENERVRREQGSRAGSFLGASWNTMVPVRLLEEKLLSPKGEAMARWMPGQAR